jgi:hypothetical protein
MIKSTPNLSVLFARMEWPSLLVREQAASQIVRLLKSPETREVAGPAFIDWLTKRKLESFAANALLIPLRLKADGADIIHDMDTYETAIGCPSVLSQLLLDQIRGAEYASMEWTNWHSGDGPPSFQADAYFERYKRAFVPEIYDIRAEQVERDFMIPFRRQWAYECHCLFERARLPKSGPPHYFLRGVRSEDRRVLFDAPQSEVFRSAFLRAIAWAVDVAELLESAAKIFALGSCPLDIGAWKLDPIERPDWWPCVHPTATGLDTTAGEIWREVELLWQRQVNSDTSEILVQASGHVFANDTTIYDLEIFGAFQKFSGGEKPPLDEVIEWLEGSHITRPTKLASTIEGKVQPVAIAEHIRQFDGWSLVPAAFRLMSWCSGRWQADRMLMRGVWTPSPYLVSGVCSIFVSPEMLKVDHDDQTIARWMTWNDHLLDDWYRDIPPPVGECLWVKRDLIARFCERNRANFCWIVRQRSYHRQYTYNPFERAEIFDALGISHIVR